MDLLRGLQPISIIIAKSKGPNSGHEQHVYHEGLLRGGDDVMGEGTLGIHLLLNLG